MADNKTTLRNFVINTLRNSGNSLEFAQKITGKKRQYTQSQIESIVLDWLEANNYGNDEICSVMDIHIDKPYFDIYYECMTEKAKENSAIEKAKKSSKLNANGVTYEKNKIVNSTQYDVTKIMMATSTLFIVGLGVACYFVK